MGGQVNSAGSNCKGQHSHPTSDTPTAAVTHPSCTTTRTTTLTHLQHCLKLCWSEHPIPVLVKIMPQVTMWLLQTPLLLLVRLPAAAGDTATAAGSPACCALARCV